MAHQNNIDSTSRKPLERSAQYCAYQYRRQNVCGHGNRVLSASDIDADELKTIMVSDVSVRHVLIGDSINQGMRRKHVHRKCSGGSGVNEISSAWTVSQYVESLLPAWPQRCFCGSIIAEVFGYWASHLSPDMTLSPKVG